MGPAHGGGASMILVGQGLATSLSVIVPQKVISALSRRTPGTGGPL
jgi:hypothetical protein